MLNTVRATQPAPLAHWKASGSAVATAATPMLPCAQSHTANAPVPPSSRAFMVASVPLMPVTPRASRRLAAVCASTASRTKASSSCARANNLTVRMFV